MLPGFHEPIREPGQPGFNANPSVNPSLLSPRWAEAGRLFFSLRKSGANTSFLSASEQGATRYSFPFRARDSTKFLSPSARGRKQAVPLPSGRKAESAQFLYPQGERPKARSSSPPQGERLGEGVVFCTILPHPAPLIQVRGNPRMDPNQVRKRFGHRANPYPRFSPYIAYRPPGPTL